MTDILSRLAAPFPPSQVLWRQGPGGTRLAYVDVRTVRRRLNEVCGPFWQSRIVHTHSERVAGNGKERVFGHAVCELSIKVDGEWITRTDAADASDIEGIKGMASDALKRAAFSFGIGEYMYDMPDRVPDEYAAAAEPFFVWLSEQLVASEDTPREWWKKNIHHIRELPLDLADKLKDIGATISNQEQKEAA